MSFHHTDYFIWNTHELEPNMLWLIDSWFNNNSTLLSSLPAILEGFAIDNGITLNLNDFLKFKKTMHRIVTEKQDPETGCYPYLSSFMGEEIWDRNKPWLERKIRYKIFQEFSPLIHSLWSKKNPNNLRFDKIASIVANILNHSSHRQKYIWVNNSSVLELHQNGHQDVFIKRYPVLQNLFSDSNVLSIPEKFWDSSENYESISLFQETTSLFASLLVYCLKNKLYPTKVEKLKAVPFNVPSRKADSYSLYRIKKYTGEKNELINWQAWASKWWWWSYLSSVNDDELEIYTYEKDALDIESFQKNTIMKLNSEEVLEMIMGIYHLPWRSTAEVYALFESFKVKYRELHGEPNIENK